jgi:hypothetical protein
MLMNTELGKNDAFVLSPSKQSLLNEGQSNYGAFVARSNQSHERYKDHSTSRGNSQCGAPSTKEISTTSEQNRPKHIQQLARMRMVG